MRAEGYDANLSRVPSYESGETPVTCVFVRGFVEHIRCLRADWLTYGQSILRNQPLRNIYLDDCGIVLQIALVVHAPRTPKLKVPAWFFSKADRTVGRRGYRSTTFATRDALIEKMAIELKEWGIGEIVTRPMSRVRSR